MSVLSLPQAAVIVGSSPQEEVRLSKSKKHDQAGSRTRSLLARNASV